jgi:hypothetical protein
MNGIDQKKSGDVVIPRLDRGIPVTIEIPRSQPRNDNASSSGSARCGIRAEVVT